MNDHEHGEQPHEHGEHAHDIVKDFSVSVEQQDGGWAVIKHADGARTVIEHHPDEETARKHAANVEGMATRYVGAAREEAIPDGYPGKGVNETDNVPPESPGA